MSESETRPSEGGLPVQQGGQLDLNQLARAQNFALTLSQEHDDERQARLRREERAHRREIAVSFVKLGALILALFAVGGIAAYILLGSKTASADDRKWALTTLSALLSGALGFVAGEKAGERKKD